jgi:N-methylhydantoinase A/oxoprolinase/acetone carboxylase beta subunit
MLDIHTVGAGGGSIAYIDQAGVLQVGPLSAGADPGPVCYGKGEKLTVTDANLLLGRLLPEAFLGGRMTLDIDRSQRFAEIMAKELGTSVLELCLGIITIVTAEMVKAVRTVSLDRGHDPADFVLYSFGGSSGLHCCDLATDLGLNTIEIPARGGVLSAQGLVFATPLLDQTKGLFLQGEACTHEGIRQECQKVEAEVCEKLRSMVVGGDLFCRSYADMRYVGQSYEIAVVISPNMEQEFHARHKQLFGYDLPDRPLECVSIRSVAQKETAEMELPLVALSTENPSPGLASVAVSGGVREIAVYKPADLPKQGVDGPCLIVDDYTTILVTESFSAQPDEYGGLILKKENYL